LKKKISSRNFYFFNKLIKFLIIKRQYLPFNEFYYLTNAADADDLYGKLLNYNLSNEKGHCDTFVKIVNGRLLAGVNFYFFFKYFL